MNDHRSHQHLLLIQTVNMPIFLALASIGLVHTATTDTSSLVFRGGAAVQLSALRTAATSLGVAYSAALVAKPILTKSLTSAAIFALSDASAQRLESSGTGKRDGKRTLVTALIGLCYYGPALHFYLNWVTWLIPGDGLLSTLLKTLVGQLGFGPVVTCIFFGAFLISEFGLSAGLRRWPAKIKQDLFVTWASELCFWPFVDLICFSFVPLLWIPLGYNLANFFWTIFLAMQASKPIAGLQKGPRP